MTEAKLYDCYHWLLACEFFTEGELRLTTDLCGYNMDTLNLLVYSRYGYRTVDDLMKEVRRMTEAKLYNCYHWLLACEFFTEQELKLITDMCGYNIDTLDKAVYCRYGYRTVEDLIEEVGGNE